MKLNQKQIQVLNQPKARINVYDGSVRSGKTTIANVIWLNYCRHYKGKAPLLMFGKTERTLYRNVISNLEPIATKTGDGEYSIFDKKVHVVGANDERAYKKIAGGTYGGVLGDEWTLAPKSFTDMLFSRLSVKGAEAHLTTNPESPFHYVKTDYIDRKETISLNHYHFLLDDNPILPEEYVNHVKSLYTGLFYKRYILGQWVAAEGAVYDMLDIDRHVVRHRDIDHKNLIRFYVGVDYGTSNATVFILLGQHKNGEFYVIDEYKHSGREKQSKSDQQYVADFKKWIDKRNIDGIYIDPSAKSFIVALNNAGVKRIYKANNAVVDGIRNVGSLLSNDLLYFSDNCTETIKGLSSYYWDSKAQEKGDDKPLKENDHEADALRYPIHSTFPKWKWILQHRTETIDRLEGAVL